MIVNSNPAFSTISKEDLFKANNIDSLEGLTGYYQFNNNDYFPGVQPNSSIYIKIEESKAKGAKENNCVIVKFLVSEFTTGETKENTYYLRNDGKLVDIKKVTESAPVDLQADMSKFQIFPLKATNNEPHLVGTEFNVLGTFAYVDNCDIIQDFLFPLIEKVILPEQFSFIN